MKGGQNPYGGIQGNPYQQQTFAQPSYEAQGTQQQTLRQPSYGDQGTEFKGYFGASPSIVGMTQQGGYDGYVPANPYQTFQPFGYATGQYGMPVRSPYMQFADQGMGYPNLGMPVQDMAYDTDQYGMPVRSPSEAQVTGQLATGTHVTKPLAADQSGIASVQPSFDRNRFVDRMRQLSGGFSDRNFPQTGRGFPDSLAGGALRDKADYLARQREELTPDRDLRPGEVADRNRLLSRNARQQIGVTQELADSANRLQQSSASMDQLKADVADRKKAYWDVRNQREALGRQYGSAAKDYGRIQNSMQHKLDNSSYARYRMTDQALGRDTTMSPWHNQDQYIDRYMTARGHYTPDTKGNLFDEQGNLIDKKDFIGRDLLAQEKQAKRDMRIARNQIKNFSG